MKDLRMYQLLEKIGFTRVGGTNKELEAAHILMDEIKTIGGTPYLQEFTVNDQDIHHVSLKDNLGNEYEVSAYGCCLNTPTAGVTAKFHYLETETEIDLYLAKNKIVLVNQLSYELYKKLLQINVQGIITFNGDVYDTKETNDLHIKELRDLFRKEGLLPLVHMRATTAMQLVRNNPDELTLNIQQTEKQSTSRNVIVEIKGTTYPEQEITFTAHYDSVLFSKGVYDNGSGSVIIMELYRYFMEKLPKRTLRFIWCGSEERGLLGSKHYVYNLSEEEIKKIVLNINVDVAGAVLGREAAVVLGNSAFVDLVTNLSKEHLFPINVREGIYSSDSIPFADKGVPAINFMRFGVQGTAHIHDRYDTLHFLSKEALYKTYSFVEIFSEKVANTDLFLIDRVIPEKIVNDVNNYLKKKKGEK